MTAARDRIAATLAGRWLSYGDDGDGVDDLMEHGDRSGARILPAHAALLADALLAPGGPVAAIVAEELASRAGMVRQRAANEEDDLPDVADALDEVSAWLASRAAAIRENGVDR